MILKDKQYSNANSPKVIAGLKQEKDVAFFLRRAFKDHEQIFVFNDFRFSHNGETAQIDHLIVYTYGFILIESKSIAGEVKVNKQGEWTRSIGKKWTGMPSPIKQVELQQDLFRQYLHAHRQDILPKILGIKQQSFGLRCWHNICAVSSNAIIDRDSIPKSISEQIIKSEFLVEALMKIMNLKHKLVSTFTLDTRPDFSDSELRSITKFLLQSANEVKEPEPASYDSHLGSEESHVENSSTIECKQCGETSALIPNYGRYGYYVTCKKCDANTSMKAPCKNCGSKNTKVSKKKNSYSLICLDCEVLITILS